MTNKLYKLSVNVIIRRKRDQILLLKRSPNSRINPDRWDLPGGKVDACEEFQEALQREVLEETGISIAVTGLAGAAESVLNGTHVIFIIMKAVWKSGEVRLSNEHDDFRWVDPEKIRSMDLCEQFRDVVEGYSFAP